MEYEELILTENPSIQFDDLSVPDHDTKYFLSQFDASKWITHLIKLCTLTDKFPESLDIIKHIIENDPTQVNKQSKNGWTPLMVACANAGHPNNKCEQVVKMLRDANCDVNIKNKEGNTALMIASEHYRSTDNDTYKNIVKMLLDADCDINAQNNYGETALIIAAVKIDEQSKLNSGKELLNMLIDANCDVNIVDENGDSALLKACHSYYADEEVVYMLIRAGSKVNEKNKEGHTPLHMACFIVGASINKVKLLLDNGCNIDAQDNDGFTALMRAIISSNNDIAKLLLSVNCNVDLQDGENITALMWLFLYGNADDSEFVVYLIMRSRKSVNAVDNNGYTAYKYYIDRDIDILDDYTLRILKNEICVNNTKSANRK